MGLMVAMTAMHILMADPSEFSLDVNSEKHEGNAFTETAKIRDPKTKEALSRRLTDALTDALRWGYI